MNAIEIMFGSMIKDHQYISKSSEMDKIIIYEKGKEVWRNVGYISEEDLKKHL
jgi:hypothetical protein